MALALVTQIHCSVTLLQQGTRSVLISGLIFYSTGEAGEQSLAYIWKS